MNTSPVVTQRRYKAAQYSLKKINPVVSALEKLDKQAIGLESDMLEVIAFDRFIRRLRDANLTIIDQGKNQVDNRPIDLLNRAIARSNQIPVIIELEEKRFSSLVNSRKKKVDELNSKGFSTEEIDKITPPLSQSQYDESKGIVAGLNDEAVKLKAFIADAPEYRLNLLEGTSLEAFLK